MVRRDGAAIRKQRIQEIATVTHQLLHQHSKISLSKTIAKFQYEYGLTEEKIKEYLQILAKLEHFTLDTKKDQIRQIIEPEAGRPE